MMLLARVALMTLDFLSGMAMGFAICIAVGACLMHGVAYLVDQVSR